MVTVIDIDGELPGTGEVGREDGDREQGGEEKDEWESHGE